MVVRVFHMKLDEYLDDIKEGCVFGPISAGNPVYHSTIPSFCPSVMLALSDVLIRPLFCVSFCSCAHR